MAIEDSYKPFWEKDQEKNSEDRLKNAAEGIAIQSEINQEIINNVEKESSKPSHGSFEEYLIKERVTKTKRVKEIEDITTHTLSTSIDIIPIIVMLIGIGAVIGVGYLVITTIQSTVPINTTSWQTSNNSTIQTFGNTIIQPFGLFSPVIFIIFICVTLMMFTRRRSIIPFVITSFCVMLAVFLFDASPLLFLIPGGILIFKTMSWSSLT